METHPGKITVGRAVTAQFLPHRPDYHDAVQQAGLSEGRGSSGGQNSWIIEQLEMGDVMVVDIFGKIKDGTIVGDNLGTAVRTRTRAGAVINGGIRDLQGLVTLEDVNFYIRGVDPTAIADVTLAGINIPIKIGAVTVLPGDVVLGTPTGTIFIPPHLAHEVVERSEDIRVRDEFGKMRIAEGAYTSGEIDMAWREDIEADFQAWKQAQTQS
jgi:regulator of RNase E activity RraA